jgi:Tol biopolymer transport system component
MMRIPKTLIGIAALAAVVVPALPAPAAFPGANGWIAFTAQTEADTDVCVMGPDWPHGVRVASGPGDQRQPAWSPDGTRLAYVTGPDDAPRIEILNVNTWASEDVGDGFFPAWAPDGQHLVFNGPGGIYVMDADGGNRRQIVTGGLRPVWSPDDSAIAFDDDLRNEVVDEGGIFLVEPDGSDEREISGGEYPDWSPDGTRLVANNGYWAGALFTMGADGTDQQTLLEGNAAQGPLFFDPVWSPASDAIAYSRITLTPTTSNSDIWAVAPDGTNARALRATRHYEGEVDWQPVTTGPGDIVGGTRCTPYPDRRSVRMRLSRHMLARGRVIDDGDLLRDPACTNRVTVEVRRLKADGWRVHTTRTDPEGRFAIELPDVAGRYRAVVRGGPGLCSWARSPILRHTHR